MGGVLFLTHERIASSIAGPSVRVVELARVLAKSMRVEIASSEAGVESVCGVQVRRVERDRLRDLRAMLSGFDVVIAQGHLGWFYDVLLRFEGAVVIDLYNPFQLESLEMFSDRAIGERLLIDEQNKRELVRQLLIGDVFLCANERQKHLWQGALLAVGRINARSADNGGDLVRIVPFGVSHEPPVMKEHGIRGRLRGIGPDDKVLIWGGGIWNWLDPLTPIMAVEELSKRRSDVKLVFMGFRHPSASVPEMRVAAEAYEYCKSQKLIDRVVFFNQWTRYEQRADFLLDADVGVSAHKESLETIYSNRTRVLDYIWAELPIVSTAGDAMAELIEANEVGICPPPGDVRSYARAIERLIDDEGLIKGVKERMRKLKAELSWEKVAAPLVEFCQNPRHSSDRSSFLKKVFALEDALFDRVSAAHCAGDPALVAYLASSDMPSIERRYAGAVWISPTSLRERCVQPDVVDLCFIFLCEELCLEDELLVNAVRVLKRDGVLVLVEPMFGLAESEVSSCLGGPGVMLLKRRLAVLGLAPVDEGYAWIDWGRLIEPELGRYGVIELCLDAGGPTERKACVASWFSKLARLLSGRFLSDFLSQLNHDLRAQLNREMNLMFKALRDKIYEVNYDFFSNIISLLAASLQWDGSERPDVASRIRAFFRFFPVARGVRFVVFKRK